MRSQHHPIADILEYVSYLEMSGTYPTAGITSSRCLSIKVSKTVLMPQRPENRHTPNKPPPLLPPLE